MPENQFESPAQSGTSLPPEPKYPSRTGSAFWRTLGLVSLVLSLVLVWDRGALFLRQLRATRVWVEDFGLAVHPVTDFLLSVPSSGYYVALALLTVVLIVKEFLLNGRPLSTVVNISALATTMLMLNVWLSAMLYDNMNLSSELWK
jgi:hypothetical protein